MWKTKGLTEEQKKSWSTALTVDMMSSEESESDSEAAIVVRPLPWRSRKVESLFDSMDKKHYKNARKRSQKMSFSRRVGDPSDRPRPNGNYPNWMFTTSE